jgi:hypothetical protein
MKMLDFSHIINVLHFFFLFNFYLKKLNFLHSLYNAELIEISVSATQTFMRENEKGFEFHIGSCLIYFHKNFDVNERKSDSLFKGQVQPKPK